MNITQTQAYNIFYSSIKKEKLYSLITSPNNKILVGVSGGSDSVFLLLSLLEVTNINHVSVAHINYSLRGKDSDNDQLFVENLCREKNIKLFSKKVSIINKSNLEAKCRKIRFDFFKELSHEHNYNIIALAHILEDRVETLIMKLLKGGSLETMIQPFPKFTIDNLTYIRPLINTPKELIIEALHSIEQEYRTDKTNFEKDFLRNKIRNSILPEFDKINPGWKKSATKLINNLTNENSYLNQKTQYIINKHLTKVDNDTSFKIKLHKLFKLNRAIILRVLVSVIKIISDYNTILSQDIIERIAKKLHTIYRNKNLSGTINIYQNKDISIKTVYSELIVRTNNPSTVVNQLQELTIDLNRIKSDDDNSLSINFKGYKINCRRVNHKKDFDYKIEYSENTNVLRLFTKIKKGSDDDNIKICFRQVKNGDKINIRKKSKKNINKILGDYKIPIEDRKKSFLIEVYKPEINSSQIVALIIHNNLLKSRINYLNYVRKTEESYFIIRFDIKYVL